MWSGVAVDPMIKASKRRRNSLSVNGISSGAGALRSRSAAVVTARNAIASIANVVHRYHEHHRRTWCSSRPGLALRRLERFLDLPSPACYPDSLIGTRAAV